MALLTGNLIGCTVFPNPEPPRVLDLPAATSAYQADSARPYSLRIDTPYASEPFNSTRVLAKPSPWEFRVFEGVRWRDTAPVIIRDLLVRDIRASKGFQNVVSDTSPADTDWTLITELSAFHAENSAGTFDVLIALHAQIVNNGSKATLCAHSFAVEQAASGAAIEQVIEAFSQAGAAMSEAVTRWATECRGLNAPETDQTRLP
ncbi:hypothetical protein BKP64_06450 [Marinobacter salinus]|uniref:ABC-type transport auxiliary lipoprotein component domain-containing protein n=2 Tax=Marinobacter salinus TaxID=1874317 RepID=A0A1D9GRK1_9GAMM|nr:hypothetical protein BKP64_06450 [Marinobacter salinus]